MESDEFGSSRDKQAEAEVTGMAKGRNWERDGFDELDLEE